jgi:hypothetical protein
MTFDNLFYRTGDPVEDMRRTEHIAWGHYLSTAKTLADLPLNSGNIWQTRRRLQAAKARFAQAWRALDEVAQ